MTPNPTGNPVELPTEAAGGVPATTVLSELDGAVVKRTVLPCGARVLTEAMPGQRSASIGCWVGVGSRDETRGHFGSTHFLEHLLFKGTERRDAMDIASAFDAVGGEANAATGKEHTTYYARVLDSDLPMAIDVVTDMVTSAVLDDDDFTSEREVILEELAMNDDDPGDVAHEKFAELVLGQHPLARPSAAPPTPSAPSAATTSGRTTASTTSPPRWSSPRPGAWTTTRSWRPCSASWTAPRATWARPHRARAASAVRSPGAWRRAAHWSWTARPSRRTSCWGCWA